MASVLRGTTQERSIESGRQVRKMLGMNRSDLIVALAARFPNLMAKDAEVSVKEILDAIGHSLARGDRVEIRGFGSFQVNYRPARKARNPKTGESVMVPPKRVPHFKAGKEMRENVDQATKNVRIRLAA